MASRISKNIVPHDDSTSNNWNSDKSSSPIKQYIQLGDVILVLGHQAQLINDKIISSKFFPQTHSIQPKFYHDFMESRRSEHIDPQDILPSNMCISGITAHRQYDVIYRLDDFMPISGYPTPIKICS